MTAPSKTEILHAYRHLYRALLRAIQYSAPARYTARDRLRGAFREHPRPSPFLSSPQLSDASPAIITPAASSSADTTTTSLPSSVPSSTDDLPLSPPFDPKRIRHTIWFLNNAARERGLEHKIVKNLLRVAYERQREEAMGTRWKDVLARSRRKDGGRGGDEITATAYRQYERTIAMLNHSMGLCLR